MRWRSLIVPRRHSVVDGSQSRRRVAKTLGAQIFHQAIIAGVQVALVPILLKFWGAERYGVWLLLAAVPTYLTFADLGFTLSAKNEMTIKTARGDYVGALITYQSIFLLLNVVTGAALVGTTVGVFTVNFVHLFAIGNTSEWTARTVLLLLAANVLVSQYQLLFAAGLRCAGRPAEEVLWGASARLGEGIVTAGTAILGGDIVHAALAIVLSRVAFSVAGWWRLKYVAPWLPLGYAQVSAPEVRKLFHPSLSFMVLYIGQALIIQGPVIVLGLIGTPIQIVVFSASRTLARLGAAGGNALNSALTPEFSRLFGMGKLIEYRRLASFHFGLTVAIAVLYLSFLLYTGDWILRIWTHGHVSAEQPFFLILLLAVSAEIIWTALLVQLASINHHTRVAYTFATLAVIALSISYVTGQHERLAGLAAPLLAVHVVMIVVVCTHLWNTTRTILGSSGAKELNK